MATFAHTENGYALDCKENDSLDDYMARYGAGPQRDGESDEDFAKRIDESPASKWKIEKVAAGTVDSAKPDGQGGWKNPEPPATPAKPDFITLDGSGFIALVGSVIGFARMDQLISKSKTIEALLLKAEKVDRLAGNTPAALAYLKTGADALTDQELANIDAAWKAKK